MTGHDADQTQQLLGVELGPELLLWSSSCTCEPPADGWEDLCWCGFAGMSSTVCERVAVQGSQRSQLAAADCGGSTQHGDPDCFALVATQNSQRLPE